MIFWANDLSPSYDTTTLYIPSVIFSNLYEPTGISFLTPLIVILTLLIILGAVILIIASSPTNTKSGTLTIISYLVVGITWIVVVFVSGAYISSPLYIAVTSKLPVVTSTR